MSVLAQDHAGRGLNIINFDDGALSVYTLAAPVMQRYNLRGQIAVIPDYADAGGGPGYESTMSVAQLKDLYDNHGWDVVSHGKDHTDFAGRSRAEQAADMAYCRDWLIDNEMPRGAHHMVFPHGSYDANTLLAMNDSGILTGRTAVLASVDGHVADPRTLGTRYIIDAEDSISGGSFYAYATSAVGGGCWYFCFHQFRDGAPGGEMCSIEHFETFCGYCFWADLEMCTVAEWHANQSGPITLPDDFTRCDLLGHPAGFFEPTRFKGTWRKGRYPYVT